VWSVERRPTRAQCTRIELRNGLQRGRSLAILFGRAYTVDLDGVWPRRFGQDLVLQHRPHGRSTAHTCRLSEALGVDCEQRDAPSALRGQVRDRQHRQLQRAAQECKRVEHPRALAVQPAQGKDVAERDTAPRGRRDHRCELAVTGAQFQMALDVRAHQPHWRALERMRRRFRFEADQGVFVFDADRHALGFAWRSERQRLDTQCVRRVAVGGEAEACE
jgi:hypothetical protein